MLRATNSAGAETTSAPLRRIVGGFRPETYAVLGAAVLLSVLRYDIIASGGSWCLFDRVLGVQCWGCGITRGLWLMLHGRFVHAQIMNPWSGVVACIAAAAVAGDVVRVVRRVAARGGIP